MKPLTPAQKKVLNALRKLGGEADTNQIAAQSGLSRQGTSQVLSALAKRNRDYPGHGVKFQGYKRATLAVWKLPN